MRAEEQGTATTSPVEARRAFLKRCGRYAVVAPPTISLLLAGSTKPSAARATYGGNTASSRKRKGGWLRRLFSKLF